jgi:transcriptional regulator with XRE-family HTH domain
VIDREQAQIAFRLSEFVKNREWTKAEFARRMQIRVQHVNGYLNGNLDPRNLVSQLAREGCDLEWLITGKSASERKLTSEEEREMLEFLESIGIMRRKQIEDLLNPENIARDVATLLRERFKGFKVKKG